MRRAPAVTLSSGERRLLARWASETGPYARRATRARIALESAAGRTNERIAERLGVTTETVTRWRTRFATSGIAGLEREAPRAGASARVPEELVERVVLATVEPRTPGDPGWSTRSLARELRTNHMAVHRIWQAYRLGASAAEAQRTARLRRVDLAGTFPGARASAVVFLVEEPGAAHVPRAVAETGTASEFDAATLARRLSRRFPKRPARATGRTRRASSAALLVFLRSLEQRTERSARLEAVFDRPLDDLGDRVEDWLRHHPRFRIYTTPQGGTFEGATRSWLRRWSGTPLHPASFRELTATTRRLPDRVRSHSSPGRSLRAV